MNFLGCDAVYPFTKLHGVTSQTAVILIEHFVFSSQTALSYVPHFCVQIVFILDMRLVTQNALRINPV